MRTLLRMKMEVKLGPTRSFIHIRSMKIALLLHGIPNKKSDKENIYDRLCAAAIERGHEIDPILVKYCQADFSENLAVRFNGESRPDIKVLLYRAAFPLSEIDSQLSIPYQFALSGVRIINHPDAVAIAKNKVKQLQLFVSHGIPMPRSCVIKSSTEIETRVLGHLRTSSVVVKKVNGSQGVGVMIADTVRSLKSLCDTLLKEDASTPLILQEFVEEADKKDLRIFVVNNRVIAAMERSVAAINEFRTNYSLGGTTQAITPTPEEIDIALRATAACKLDIAGVDVIRTSEGPKILEINAAPGFEGITETTGCNVAQEIIDYTIAVMEGRATSYYP